MTVVVCRITVGRGVGNVGGDDTTAKGAGSTRVMRELRASTEERAEPENQGCDLANYRSLEKSDPHVLSREFASKNSLSWVFLMLISRKKIESDRPNYRILLLPEAAACRSSAL